MKVSFEDNSITFKTYPFWCSSVKKNQQVRATDIASIQPSHRPLEIILQTSEILFLPTEAQQELVNFATRNNIPPTDYSDVWSIIQTEFLDTEFTPFDQQCTHRLLGEYGIDLDEFEKIKLRIGKRVSFDNFFRWEWVHLGHFDMLQANLRFRFPHSDTFKKLYWDSMEIARRASRFPNI
ncbi:MAG: hypothetical protein NT027_11375 [Proteobacteria bacterium]|nr:hypothetical protein [Pseudomonadota bacterium]